MFFHFILLVVSLIGFLRSFHVSSCDEHCADRPVFTPARLVVKHGDPTSADCSPCQHACVDHHFNVESPVGHSTISGTKISWTANMTAWQPSILCYYTLPSQGQCCSKLNVTVYHPPHNVSFSFDSHTGPMFEGHQYTLQCTVEDVAPVENLIVTFYRGQTALGKPQSINNTEKKPVTEDFTLNITPSKEDDGGRYWCEAKLELGSEGPQPPPVVTSQTITATVHYKPQLEGFYPGWITVTEGYPLQLNCSAVGNPSPSYTWMLPLANISSSSPNGSVHSINSVTSEDEGQYTCSVSNDVGTVTVTFDVLVTGFGRFEFNPNQTAADNTQNNHHLQHDNDTENRTQQQHHCQCSRAVSVCICQARIVIEIMEKKRKGGAEKLHEEKETNAAKCVKLTDVFWAVAGPVAGDGGGDVGGDVQLPDSFNFTCPLLDVTPSRLSLRWKIIRQWRFTFNFTRTLWALGSAVVLITSRLLTRLLAPEKMVFSYKFLVVSLMTFLRVFHMSFSCDEHCADRPVFTPARLVVKHGDPTSADCSPCQHACVGHKFNVESPVGHSTISGTKISWTANMTAWQPSILCYYTLPSQGQCCNKLNVTVYQPPRSVSFSFDSHTGPMFEGHQYTLQCTVEDVAPVENLIVTFYRGQTALGKPQSSNNTEKKPVTEDFTLNITPSKEDDGGQYWCEAKLELGPGGPQPPPVVTSQTITATVYYKPQRLSTDSDLITVAEGDPLQLNCLAVGNPSPTYTWTSDNPFYSNGSVLNIHSVTSEHKGQYNCSVSNHVGTLTVTFNVDVEGEFEVFRFSAVSYIGIIIGVIAAVALLVFIILAVLYSFAYKANRMGQYNLKDVFRLRRQHSAVPSVE
ncbi:uncharacterized protein LOC117951886 [Etheostoma cragini]|uniref:uncharacterized protein LOC117951886 n=1 Tax=Etheostoma cragini TaxID=417921 RepID=UPI00155E03B2|nr:uncharacterized protein LOC117951886 [Etheostoma cragini]